MQGAQKLRSEAYVQVRCNDSPCLILSKMIFTPGDQNPYVLFPNTKSLI